MAMTSGGEESSAVAEAVFLDRTARPTRGKRLTRLLDEELEEDETFWNQDALKDEEDDINYVEEKEAGDLFDSDFDEDEPEPEAAENDADVRERSRKRLVYPGKPANKKKSKKKTLVKLEKVSRDELSSRTQETGNSDEHRQDTEIEGEKIVRKSSRTSVVVREAERAAIRAAMQATMKPIKRRKEGEERRMTQEEMLLEAAQTEIVNLRNLERVLAREEEVKKRAVINKAAYTGPQIRYTSKYGQSTLEFSEGISFESGICTTSTAYPKKSMCAVTGLPAKYRDPKTGLPYATKEAFKIIRERFSEDQNRVSKENEKGSLFYSITGQGFSSKRKRSKILNRDERSYQRHWARFRSIPALEDEILE